jgi:predicted nucleic acid-binding protein
MDCNAATDTAIPQDTSAWQNAGIAKAVKSDELPKLVSVVRHFEPFKEYAKVFQIDLILDANVVLAELIWVSKKRKNPQARSDLLELMDCATVRAHAPTFLAAEVEFHLPKIARKHRISEEAMRVHWDRFRVLIRFVDVGGPEVDTIMRDPKDAPYLRLQKQIDALIATYDTDIAGMGGQVIRIQLLAPLKSYSRHAAVEYQLKVAGIGSVMLLTAVAAAVVNGTKSMSGHVGKLPKSVLWLLAVLVVCALLHPTSRKRIFEIVENIWAGAAGAVMGGIEMIGPIVTEHYTAKQNAQLELDRAKTMLLEAAS